MAQIPLHAPTATSNLSLPAAAVANNTSPLALLSASLSRNPYWRSALAALATYLTPTNIKTAVAGALAVWWVVVHVVKAIGSVTILRRYRRPLPTTSKDDAVREKLPGVTILRPITGVDAQLEACLESTFRLSYPKDKYELLLCLPSEDDAAVPIVRELVKRYEGSGVCAKVLIGEDDVGPNPKIRNMLKGYRAARNDILWILDANVWVPEGILERSVGTLCGLDTDVRKLGRPYKLVHHLPLAIACDDKPSLPSAFSFLGHGSFGGRLEETFLSTSHAQFYTAINTVDIAPCLVGKSNLFRRSHLDALTREKLERKGIVGKDADLLTGVAYFSENICEDHLIGDLLYYHAVPNTQDIPSPSGRLHPGRTFGNHILGDDVVIQPMAAFPTRSYLARRTRWLRVRKWTVLAATMVEPLTESLASVITGWTSWGYLLGWSWRAMALAGTADLLLWHAWDRYLSLFLHTLPTTQVEGEATPGFVRERSARREWREWAVQWVGREVCAFPIWVAAMVWSEVRWRGGVFRVGKDMRVRRVGGDKGKGVGAEAGTRG